MRNQRGRREVTSKDLRDELALVIGLSIVAIVSVEAQETGKTSGEMQCPRCLTGTLHWAIAPNGHVRGRCDRQIVPADGTAGTAQEPSYCVAFIQ